MAAPSITDPDSNLVPLDTLARLHGASRLPLPTAMYLGANIARAVAEHHERGHVLGTLDANRIRCSHDGRVVIAKDGGSFMAPEVKRGEPPDVLSDIYAVGAIIYRLLTGLTPLQAMTRQPVSRLHEVPCPSSLIPGIDPTLDEVLLSALATDPGERPFSVKVLASTIDAIFEELELVASPSGVVRAVAATDSKRLKPRPESWTAEYTQPGSPEFTASSRTESHSVATEVTQTPANDERSIIVSPSLCQPAVRGESPTIQTTPGSDLVQPTRDELPEVGNPTTIERPSRLGLDAQAETPTQSLSPRPTSLIYGHPFFRRDTGDVESLSSEVEAPSFADEVYVDARQRLARKWRYMSPAGRRCTIAAVVGAVAVLAYSTLMALKPTDASVEVGDAEVSMAKAPVKIAPVPVALAPAPVEPARPAVKVEAPPAQVSKGKVAKKLTKKQLAAKKKAAKRAARRASR